MSNFRVGQKVVCVDTSYAGRGTRCVDRYLKEGAVYEIRWIGECPYRPWRSDGLGVRLVGIVRGGSSWPDFPFKASRFRPLIEHKTSIEVFRRMLVPSKESAPVSIAHSARTSAHNPAQCSAQSAAHISADGRPYPISNDAREA